MRIHNLMEEIVISTVEEIYNEEEQKKQFGFCTCNQCRLDSVCYVLNRVPAQYVISGRGLAHYETESQKNYQRNIDLVMLVHQGISKVAATRRPGHDHSGSTAKHNEIRGPAFNFPTIVGRLFNGKTFEPAHEVQIILLDSNQEPVPMIDDNWQNPYLIVNNTSGNFIFWPSPEAASKTGEKKSYRFHLLVEDKRYNKIEHYFDLELTSSPEADYEMKIEFSHKIEDLYLFASGEV